jgi:serine/threonine-protein kinase Chk1
VNIEDHRVAACKLVSLSPETSEKDRKTIDKEMRVHSALKHRNVLEFIEAAVVEPQHKHKYVPGIYMLLEFAAGGDLFDKIGTRRAVCVSFGTYSAPRIRFILAPDIGVGDEVAHFYFGQLVDGIVRRHFDL